jgi:serine/threonine protein kinase
MLYEMATGKQAFEGKTTASVIAAVPERNPPPISTVQPVSLPGLDRVVKTCVAKDPDERFQNVHDVKLQLKGDRGRWVGSIEKNWRGRWRAYSRFLAAAKARRSNDSAT